MHPFLQSEGVAAAAAAGPKHTRAKHRLGTWGDILGGGAMASGRDPPPRLTRFAEPTDLLIEGVTSMTW
jgi:hypothetical protein